MSNKAGNWQSFWHHPLTKTHNGYTAMALKASGSVTTELHCVSESHSLLYYTSIHLLLSQTPIIKHKRTIMLIFRLVCKLGVPLLPRRMIAFHFKVWSSYSSLSFDYIAIRYANTRILKIHFQASDCEQSGPFSSLVHTSKLIKQLLSQGMSASSTHPLW